jgi:MFS family permease
VFKGLKSKIAKLTEAGSLWSYPGYRLFWVSTTIFVLGASAFPIALAVTIIDQGGSATALGLILGSRILASVIGAPFAGVWTDRLPRKKVMIASDLGRAVIVFSMVFLSGPATPDRKSVV